MSSRFQVIINKSVKTLFLAMFRFRFLIPATVFELFLNFFYIVIVRLSFYEHARGNIHAALALTRWINIELSNDRNLLTLCALENNAGNWSRSEFIREKLFKKALVGFGVHGSLMKLNRVFHSNTFSPIGHMGLLDVFIKAQKLGLIEGSLVIDKSDLSYALPDLLDYIHEYFIDASDIVNEKLFNEQLLRFPISESKNVSLFEFGAFVEMRWLERGNPPLFHPKHSHREAGVSWLKSLGFDPSRNWLVGLHVRNSEDPLSDARNASISNYQLAIQRIMDLGGWVVRTGARDFNITEIGNGAKIDLPSNVKNGQFLNFFVLSNCRFFIGTGSGPSEIPSIFGIPVLLTNWSPLRAKKWGRRQILLPKSFKWVDNGQELTPLERMKDEIGYKESISALQSMGICVVENSSTEILEATNEMIDEISAENPFEEEKMDFYEKSLAEEDLYQGLFPIRYARQYIRKFG